MIKIHEYLMRLGSPTSANQELLCIYCILYTQQLSSNRKGSGQWGLKVLSSENQQV
jgi:hypothetical protein